MCIALRNYIRVRKADVPLQNALLQDDAPVWQFLARTYRNISMMAIGAIRAIHDSGLSIPDDIALISFGSLAPFDLFNDSKISEIKQPTLARGDECASIMLEKLHRNRKHRPQNAKRTVFDSELLIRGSEIYPVNRKKAKE